MLQNEAEMYNLGIGGNARYCNGHIQLAPGMASKKECKIKNSKMVPNKDDVPSSSVAADSRVKFSDRLKALLKSGSSSSDAATALLKVGHCGGDSIGSEVKPQEQPDDPYTFSEPETQVIRLYHQNTPPNHTYSRHNLTLNSKLVQKSVSSKTNNAGVKIVTSPTVSTSDANIKRLYPNLSASLGHVYQGNPASMDANLSSQIQPKKIVPCGSDNKVSDDESSKTMNRLQAKIARNKVIGKHRKVRSTSRSPDIPAHGTAAVAGTSSGRSNSSNWQPQRERSLLEEQLLGLKTEVIVKKEPQSPPLAMNVKSSRHTITYKPQLVNHSNHPVMAIIPNKRRRSKVLSKQNEVLRHETLQRIQQVQQKLRDYKQDLYPLGVEVSDSEDSDLEESAFFQRHWFSAWLEPGLSSIEGQLERDGRLTQMKGELHRRVTQMWKGMPFSCLEAKRKSHYSNFLVQALLETAQRSPSQAALFLRSSKHRKNCHNPVGTNRSKTTMLVKRVCSYKKGEEDACSNLALPCTQHCIRHIMYNVDQLLFEHCTAKFSDNTQCCVPVFDICHELPLCLEHARKRDNYDKMCAETKPKKVRKKAKPSAMTRPNKRGKKKRRIQKPPEPPPAEGGSALVAAVVQPKKEETSDINIEPSSSPEILVPFVKEKPSSENIIPEANMQDCHMQEEEEKLLEQQQAVEVEVEEVLAIAGDLPLDAAELANQASRLLEEHDLTNVLNQIPADAFNDLFTEDKNGQYEPTREETEELERALEAVDKDVKSLEKLSQTQGLLDTLIDEHALVQTFAQLPTEVPNVMPTAIPGIVPVVATYHHYHNGFVMNTPSVAAPTHLVENPNIASTQTQTDLAS